MHSDRNRTYIRSIIALLVTLPLLALTTTVTLAGTPEQTWDPALAWEGEGRGLFRADHLVLEVDAWDPALAWEGERCGMCQADHLILEVDAWDPALVWEGEVCGMCQTDHLVLEVDAWDPALAWEGEGCGMCQVGDPAFTQTVHTEQE